MFRHFWPPSSLSVHKSTLKYVNDVSNVILVYKLLVLNLRSEHAFSWQSRTVCRSSRPGLLYVTGLHRLRNSLYFAELTADWKSFLDVIPVSTNATCCTSVTCSQEFFSILDSSSCISASTSDINRCQFFILKQVLLYISALLPCNVTDDSATNKCDCRRLD